MKLKPFIMALAGLFLLEGVSLAAPEAVGRLGFGVSPSRFRIEGKPQEAVSQKVVVRNRSSYAVRVTTDITDMASLKGESDLLYREEVPASTTPHSCARWIQILSGEGMVIPPDSEGILEFVITPPPDAQAGGYAAYLFVSGGPAEPLDKSKSDKPQVGFVTVPRLGISVMYEIAGTVHREGKLLSLQMTPPSKGQPLKLRYEFANTGNAEVILEGFFHLLDPEGMLVGKGSIQTLKSFPGERGFGETTWEETLPPGKYTLLATFELGPDAASAIVRELEFEVPA